MRLSRLVTALAATATATASLVAASVPSSAQDSAPTPIITPVVDPLRPLRALVSSDVDLNEVASLGTVAVNTRPIAEAVAIDPTFQIDPSIDWSRPVWIRYSLDNAGSISGYCTYARSGAGLDDGGGGTIRFTVAGEATAAGRYKGVEIVATGIKCVLYKPDQTVVSGPEFAPGALAVTNRSIDSYDARGGVVCAEAWALLRTVPAGGSSALVSTGMSCH